LPYIESDGHIPRILHQIYVGGPLPESLAANVRRLREMHPEWEYRFYDDTAAELVIAENYGATMLAVYRSISPHYGAARADLLRYLVLYRFGGVYIDLKSVTERPLDTVIAPEDGFILTQWDNEPGDEHEGFGFMPYVSHVSGGEFLQWFLASARGHPMMGAVIDKVTAILLAYDPLRDGTGRGVVRVTGPVPFTQAVLPLRDQCCCRYVRNHRTLGLRYSLASGMAHRSMMSGRHYTRSRHPIVDRPRPVLANLMIRAVLEAKALRRWLLKLG
jgi:mannosyltransferase OCH1-like enzyme